MNNPAHHRRTTLLFTLLIIVALTGCNLPAATPSLSQNPQTTSTPGLQKTKVTFRVTLAKPLSSGDSIYITFLDEVTGLAFNARKQILQAEDFLHYSVSLPFTIGAVVKYRYSREGASSVNEHLPNGSPVRYRLYHIEGPATVDDVISRWTDTTYAGSIGRIMGQVSDASSGAPVPNLLVTAAGEQTFSLADGSFLLEGLPPGTHNLVFYSMDASYGIYQQGAVVAEGSTTPVAIKLNQAKPVTVIFTLHVPTGTPADAPIRLAGNLAQLGNTFADLSGGVSSLASHMPTLGKLPDGRYMVTLSLPAGAYLEYKYTLGDGLWSAEETSSGAVNLRQLIVPEAELEQTDTVDAWGAPDTQPIRFEAKVPLDTPPNELVAIQFNPGFGWLESLPMWAATNSQGQPVWRFDLTGPFNNLTSLQYRYCRQYQCGSADDAATAGLNPTGRTVDPSSNPGTVTDEVASWAWLSKPNEPASVPSNPAAARAPGFSAGIAFQANYHPSWSALLPGAINQINSLSVNQLVLTPTWSFTAISPPTLEPLPSQDMLWPELVSSIDTAKQNGLAVALYPQPHFPTPADQWWQSAPRDFPWWISFFERYTSFVLHHATVAADSSAETLILGGDWLNPALPGGTLADGSPSLVPQDAETRWRDLINLVRERYHGALAWALSYPDGVNNPPPFLDAVDQVYILWSAPLADQPGATVEQMQGRAGEILDQVIQPFQQNINKPVIIAIAYPSIDQAATGCISIEGGGCLDYSLLSQPNQDISALNLNLSAQADAYNAVLAAINDRSWVSGFVSMGYYPPAVLQDKSISIHGKPTGGAIWYWSKAFLGK